MAKKKVSIMERACPACGKNHNNGGGLMFAGTDKEGVTILECEACHWTGRKVECVAPEKVED
jgi:formate dehydrogenase maturation protein FdhE